MRELPDHYNSKEDYYFIKDAVNPDGTKMFTDDQWKPVWANLLADRYTWSDIKKLDHKEDGITDATHRVSASPCLDSDEVDYYQQEVVEDDRSDFVKYGFTVDEIQSALSS